MDRLAIFEDLAEEFDLIRVRGDKAVYDRAVILARDAIMEMRQYVRGGEAYFFTTHIQAEELVREWAGIEFPPSSNS